jgi:hypothetical protein
MQRTSKRDRPKVILNVVIGKAGEEIGKATNFVTEYALSISQLRK